MYCTWLFFHPRLGLVRSWVYGWRICIFYTHYRSRTRWFGRTTMMKMMMMFKNAYIFQKSRNHLIILGLGRLAWSKFPTKDQQIRVVGVPVQNLVSRYLCIDGYGNDNIWCVRSMKLLNQALYSFLTVLFPCFLCLFFSSASCSPTLRVVLAEGERTSFRCAQNCMVNYSCLCLIL